MTRQFQKSGRIDPRRGRGMVLGLAIGLGLVGVMAAGPVLTGIVSLMSLGQLGGGPGIPLQINHQGVVIVGGERFNGDGDFRFALVDPDSGDNVWTNDGSNTGTTLEPDNPVVLTVVNGIYSVALGDTALANMETIPSTTFDDDNLVLRIWFDDGLGSGSRQLTPDHKLTSVPYAYRAATAAEAETATSAGNGVPAGTIVPYGGAIDPNDPNTFPAGWLCCDGRTVSRTTYAALYSAIGDAWGNGDGSTTFNLPDLRGRFLRGVDHGAGNDPDANDRTVSNPGGNQSDEVGSLQDDNVASHNHQAEGGGGYLYARFSNNITPNTIHWKTTSIPSYAPDSAITAPGMGPGTAPGSSSWGIQVGGVTATATGSFGVEDTRPVNCYVNYIIKY